MEKLERQLCLTKADNWNYNFKRMNEHYERARTLTHFIQTNKLIAMNDINQGPTYTSANIYQNHESYIDCILMGKRAARFFTNFRVIDLNSAMRHNMICVEAKFKQNNQQLNQNEENNHKIIKVFSWHKINQSTCSELIDLAEEIQLCVLATNWKVLPRNEMIKKLIILRINFRYV